MAGEYKLAAIAGEISSSGAAAARPVSFAAEVLRSITDAPNYAQLSSAAAEIVHDPVAATLAELDGVGVEVLRSIADARPSRRRILFVN